MNYAKIWKPLHTALTSGVGIVSKCMGVEGANQRQVAVDAAGKLTVVESSAASILAKLDVALSTRALEAGGNLEAIAAKDDLLEWAGTAGAGYAGLTDIDLTPTSAPAVGASRYVDNIEVCGTNDGGSGAASVIVYLFRDAGATPGAAKLILVTSAPIPIAAGVWADRISPNVRVGFRVPAGQKLYMKVVPDTGTITVDASAFTCAGR